MAALPMLLIVTRVIQAGINLPFFDQWFPGSSVDMALAAHARTLSPEALWQPNFEHRIVFTHLTTALLARFGQWNVKAEMLISVALAGMAAFVILARLQALSARRLPVWLGALLSALMFGLRQQNNWLWSFETCWYFALLFVTLTLALLSGPGLGAGRLVLAVASAEAASLSLGSGLLAWPLGFLILLVRTPRGMAPLLGWAAASGLGLLVQFQGQSRQLGSEERTPAPWALGRIQFVLAFLGAPLLPDRPSLLGAATVIGAVVLLALLGMVIALRRAGFSFQRLSFVLGLAAYAGGSAALVALSNRGIPETNALFGRYTTNGTLIHVAVVGLAWLLLEAGRPRLRLPVRLLVGAVPLTIALLFLATSILSWPPPPFLALPEHLACVDDYVREDRSECFDGLYPVQFTDTVRLPELAAAGLTAFADKPPRLARRTAPADDHAGLDLGLGDRHHWRPNGDLSTDPREPDTWIAGEDPFWVHLGAIHRCLRDFDSLRLELTVSGPVRQPLLQVFYTLRPTEDFDGRRSFIVPILPDGARHVYEVPLRTLHLTDDACGFRLRVDPLGEGDGERTRLQVHTSSFTPARGSGP